MAVYINTKDVEKSLQKFINDLGPVGKSLLFRKIGTRMLYMVKERTARGQGPDGPFPPYKPSTVQKRKAAGKQTAFIDLNFTGEMLENLQPSIRKDGVVLYFKGASANNKAYWNQKRFGFFNLNANESEVIIQLVKDSLNVE